MVQSHYISLHPSMKTSNMNQSDFELTKDLRGPPY